MNNIENTPDSEQRILQRDVVRKSERVVALLSENDICSVVLRKKFLNINFKHNVNVDMIIQRICIAVASLSVEAIIESIISIYEGLNNKGDCFPRKE